MPDSQPHPAKIRADVLLNGPQTVMPGMPAARLDAALARRKVQFVMQDRHLGRRQLKIAHRFAHRLPGQVHEGLRLQQHHLFSAQPPFRGQPLEPRAPRREIVIRGDPINGHPPDIVPVSGMFRPRIAQTHDQLHRIAFRLHSTHPLRLASRVNKTLSTFRPYDGGGQTSAATDSRRK